MEKNFDPAIPHRLPVHHGGFIDGRSGWQWIKSVEHYLTWRAGSAWRPVGHRFHPEHVYYTAALRTIKAAYYQNPEVCRWFAPSIGDQARVEFAETERRERERRDRLRTIKALPRKPPQSVAAAFSFSHQNQLRLFA